MDTITLPIVAADDSLKDVWQVMSERKCANVLVSRGGEYFSLSDKDLAESIVHGHRSLISLLDKDKPIKILTPKAFATASKKIYGPNELGHLHRSLERAFSSFVGHTRRRVPPPKEFVTRLEKVLQKSQIDLAIVGVHFDTATVFSRSEQKMLAAKIQHGGPGRYQCNCNARHLWEPERLTKEECPADGCGVTFIH